MAKRKREIVIRFRVTPEERSMIEAKMAQLGTSNMAAYLRKIAIDGYVVKLDLPELRDLVSLLKRAGNNINQIAKRVNGINRFYGSDMDILKGYLDKIWLAVNEILMRLAEIK